MYCDMYFDMYFDMYCDMYFDMYCDMYFDMYFDIYFDIYFDMYFNMYFDIGCRKYGSGEILCKANLGHVTPTSLSFNPANWRQVCVASSKRLSIYTTEQSSDTYLMNDR